MKFISKVIIILVSLLNINATNGNSTEAVRSEEHTESNMIISEYEYNLLLRVCMSECGGEYGEPLEGKIAVVETILNRCDMYGMTIEEVVTQPNQYSMADNGKPDAYVKEAVDIALRERSYPSDMLYFQAGNYHSFGTPYKQIGKHYFSLKGE